MPEPTTTATETDFDPSATNGIYDELKGSWELNRDLAEMHLHVLRKGGYLDPFGKDSKATEAAGQYTWRKGASMAIDHCADLINLRVDNIFRAPPVRKYEDSPYKEFIEAFTANVDGGGTDMDAFMRRALRAYYVNGVDIVVDKQAAPPGVRPVSLAQEQALDLLPYLHAFGPLERLDWACDHAGAYLWARYDMGDEPPADEMSGGNPARQFLTLTRDEWRLYRVEGEESKVTTVQRGPMTLGVCPIVPLYFKESVRSDYPKVPLSLLTRIAPIARYMLNLLSQGQLDLYLSVAFYVITGLNDPEQAPTEITPSCSWVLPEGTGIEQMGQVTEHIAEKREWLRMAMDAILRIGKLTGGSGELESRASSGVQVAVERTDLDNEMRMTATQAEAAEREIIRLAVSRYKGRPVPHDEIAYAVEYNKKYVLTPVTELIRQAKEFFGISVVEAIAAGAYPVLPKRLAYPELLKLGQAEGAEDFFYDGSVTGLANKLQELAGRLENRCLWKNHPGSAAKLVERFTWDNLIPVFDEAIEDSAKSQGC